jgi:DnaK suppressor protein
MRSYTARIASSPDTSAPLGERTQPNIRLCRRLCVLAEAVVRVHGRCEPFRVGDAWNVNKHEVEARLTAERTATSRRITSMTADLAAVAAATVGSNLDDEHDPEGSTIAFEREQLAALRAHAQVHLTEVDEALARLHDNRYGQCELCGKPIANARLAVLPATRRCITCAARAVQ